MNTNGGAVSRTDAARLTKRIQGLEVTIKGLKDTVTHLLNKVDGMDAFTRVAVMERERERQSLVEKLARNVRCSYSAYELESKPIEELRKLVQMLSSETYAGRGGLQTDGHKPIKRKRATR